MSDSPIERRLVAPRSVDADGSGALSPGVLLGTLEEVRFGLFRRIPAMAEIHRQVARAQWLALEEPVSPGLTLEVEVRLARLGRTSFEATHLVRSGAGGPVLARAGITMVCLGPDGRPTPAPRGLLAWVGDGPEAPALGEPSTRPDDAFEHAFLARPTDENRGAHVSHARFVDYLDDARRLRALLSPAAAEPPPARPRPGPAQALAVRYEGEARAGDRLVASAWPPPERQAVVDTEVRLADGRVLARARHLSFPPAAGDPSNEC